MPGADCTSLFCDNYISEPKSYYRYLWWNLWFLHPFNRRTSNRFCQKCQDLGNTTLTYEEAHKRNGGV